MKKGVTVALVGCGAGRFLYLTQALAVQLENKGWLVDRLAEKGINISVVIKDDLFPRKPPKPVIPYHQREVKGSRQWRKLHRPYKKR